MSDTKPAEVPPKESPQAIQAEPPSGVKLILEGIGIIALSIGGLVLATCVIGELWGGASSRKLTGPEAWEQAREQRVWERAVQDAAKDHIGEGSRRIGEGFEQTLRNRRTLDRLEAQKHRLMSQPASSPAGKLKHRRSRGRSGVAAVLFGGGT